VVAQQQGEQIENLRLHMQDRVPAPQLLTARVELESCKPKGHETSARAARRFDHPSRE
jgi:hypothetical protein